MIGDRAAWRPGFEWHVPPPRFRVITGLAPDTRAMPRTRGKPRRSLLDLPRAYPTARGALAATDAAVLTVQIAAAMNTPTKVLGEP